MLAASTGIAHRRIVLKFQMRHSATGTSTSTRPPSADKRECKALTKAALKMPLRGASGRGNKLETNRILFTRGEDITTETDSKDKFSGWTLTRSAGSLSPMKESVKAIGLIIIGNEILDGRRRDAHFETARGMLTAHNLKLAYALILPDQADVITAQLKWAMQTGIPFFCCGGIGSTPDDITRQCAAAAAGLPLVQHPEGTAILQAKFGDRSTPARLRMAEFAQGAALIPNPVNNVAGFSIRGGYFVPGFPEMAKPMMQWVLDTCYEKGAEQASVTYIAQDVREADLCDLMDDFVLTHPEVSFSSLPIAAPRPGFQYELHLGVSGPAVAVIPAAHHLAKALKEAGVVFTS
jgi:molybdopterin-biosynthesis enzyme MoeA-like protein